MAAAGKAAGHGSGRVFGTHRIETWNDDPRPFVWHKTADQILDGLKKYLTNL
jgi:hypothetical protein